MGPCTPLSQRTSGLSLPFSGGHFLYLDNPAFPLPHSWSSLAGQAPRTQAPLDSSTEGVWSPSRGCSPLLTLFLPPPAPKPCTKLEGHENRSVFLRGPGRPQEAGQRSARCYYRLSQGRLSREEVSGPGVPQVLFLQVSLITRYPASLWWFK